MLSGVASRHRYVLLAWSGRIVHCAEGGKIEPAWVHGAYLPPESLNPATTVKVASNKITKAKQARTGWRGPTDAVRLRLHLALAKVRDGGCDCRSAHSPPTTGHGEQAVAEAQRNRTHLEVSAQHPLGVEVLHVLRDLTPGLHRVPLLARRAARGC